jgi:hypothetical protein
VKQEEDEIEQPARNLWDKMTPEQKRIYLAALPLRAKPATFGSIDGKSLASDHGVALQVTAVENQIGNRISAFLRKFKQAQQDVLHSIFGDHIPGFPTQ